MQITTERWQTTPWWRLFGSIFLIVFALIAIWSVSMPLLSGPDEPTHVVKAAGVIRGQFTGNCIDNPARPAQDMGLLFRFDTELDVTVLAGYNIFVDADGVGLCGESSAFTEVHVPAFFSLLRNSGTIPGTSIPHHGVQCFARRVDISASCVIFATAAQYKNLVRDAWIYDGRYPPMYYVIVGVPSLFGQGLWVLYLMRLFSAAASALFLSLAIFAVLRYAKSRLYLLGVVVAATPMLIYLAGMVNANGLEASSALCFWVSTTMMVCERRPPRALIGIAAIAALVFVSSRSLSPLWIALAALSMVASANLTAIKDLLRRREVQLALCALVVVGCLDVVWILYEHATNVDVASANAQSLVPPPGTSELTILRTSFHHNIYYLPGMIAVFGAFDTYAPRLTFVIWYLLGGALFLLGLIAASARRRVVLVAVALGIVVLPVIISSSQARHLGYVWSGRDTLPFAVGLPVLCVAVLSGRRGARLVRASAPSLLALALIAQVGAFFEALRRYSVGDAGPKLSFLWHPLWSPPVIGDIGALAIEVVVLAGAYLLVWCALGGGLLHPVAARSDPSVRPGAHRPGSPSSQASSVNVVTSGGAAPRE